MRSDSRGGGINLETFVRERVRDEDEGEGEEGGEGQGQREKPREKRLSDFRTEGRAKVQAPLAWTRFSTSLTRGVSGQRSRAAGPACTNRNVPPHAVLLTGTLPGQRDKPEQVPAAVLTSREETEEPSQQTLAVFGS